MHLLTPNDPEWADVETFDYTKLTAINTCPTFGIVRYGMHKTTPTSIRPMALEAGAVAHEAFAALRLYQLRGQSFGHWEWHGPRLFPDGRFSDIASVIRDDASDDANARNVALHTIATSGFSNDPNDRRRTVDNIEASVAAYVGMFDRERFPVWIADPRDPTSKVGIEQSFDIGITFTETSSLVGDVRPAQQRIRYTGRIDGIHRHRDEIILNENKTAGRLDDGWRMAFDISHQVTGYSIAASLITGHPISRGIVWGVQLPLPRAILNGVQDVWTVREDIHRHRWLMWLHHTVTLYNQYKSNVLEAPKYSHSCNRYFRPCSLISFCYSDDADQRQLLAEMLHDEWSPLTVENNT